MLKRILTFIFALSAVGLCQQLELLSSVELPDSYVWGIDIKGNYAFLVSKNFYDDQPILRVFDISNPYSPYQIGTGDTTAYDRGEDIIIEKRGYAYIADNWSGLQIFNVVPPANPQPIAIFPTFQNAHSLFLDGNLLYMANCSSGLYILDVSDPYEPTMISQFRAGEILDLEAVYVVYPYAYLGSLNGIFAVLDVADPYNPVLLNFNGEYINYAFCDVIVDGNYAYASEDYGGVGVFDLSDPAGPRSIGTINDNGLSFKMFKYDNYLFVASGPFLNVFDISDPYSPEFVTRASDSYYCEVHVDAGKIYAGGDNHFKIYSFSITGIPDRGDSQAREFEIISNYPNPFNNKTTISYRLSDDNFVRLTVYDLLGREAVQLVNKYQVPGEYSVPFDAGELASGIYFYKLQAGEFSEMRKMLLLK